MKDKSSHKLPIGIVWNPNYEPSVLAYNNITAILNQVDIEYCDLTLNDVICTENDYDNIFNVYYGEPGDGGLISGVLEQRKFKFVGNSQLSCSLMFNKVISKLMFIKYSYKTPRYWYQPNIFKHINIIEEVENILIYPFMVKPVQGAASENVFLINNREEFNAFLNTNDELIKIGYYFFEQFIKGIEISAGYVNAISTPLPVVEIRLFSDNFQSNKVKYSHNLKRNIIPARIPIDIYQNAQNIAKELNEIFKCSMFSRIDFIYDEVSNELYVLEINGNPGLLENSLLTLMVNEAGLSQSDFLLKLISYEKNGMNSSIKFIQQEIKICSNTHYFIETDNCPFCGENAIKTIKSQQGDCIVCGQLCPKYAYGCDVPYASKDSDVFIII